MVLLHKQAPRPFLQACLGLMVWGATALSASTSDADLDDLASMSLEELGELSISTAGRRSQPWFEAPNAGNVLRSEDLTLFGSDSIDDAVQMLPGVLVTRGSDTLSAVSIRGFNSIRSNKLLVQVDGRSIQSSANGSVLWADVLFPTEDLARIEVVRGPGSTLWGANAINGVIAVTSKTARQTTGDLVSLRTATRDGTRFYLRHGAALGTGTCYRVSAEGEDSDLALGHASSAEVGRQQQAALKFRLDHDIGDSAHLSLLAEAARIRLTYPVNDSGTTNTAMARSDTDLGSVLGRLQHDDWWGGDLSIQLWASQRDGGSREAVDTSSGGGGRLVDVDLDVTHHVKLKDRHDLVWGTSAHFYSFKAEGGSDTNASPSRVDEAITSLFIQDEITLSDGSWRVIGGTKCEHHETVGWQLQPNARLAWLPSQRQTAWISVSRATRSPSEAERAGLVGVGAPNQDAASSTQISVDPNLGEERLTAYELGWRFRPTPDATIDLAGYVNNYTGLTTQATTQPGSDPGLGDQVVQNGGTARGTGIEATVTWRPRPTWEIIGSLTLPHLTATGGTTGSWSFGSEPRCLWHLRSSFELPHDLDAGVALLSLVQSQASDMDSYVRVDATLNWRPRPTVVLSVGVQDATNAEASATPRSAAGAEAASTRDVFVRGTWRF